MNGAWRNRSFRNYALTEDFAEGLIELVALGAARPVAIMCAEAVWWRCHRRIVVDHLLSAGHDVVHLMGEGREAPATSTPAARSAPGGKVVYPAGGGSLTCHVATADSRARSLQRHGGRRAYW